MSILDTVKNGLGSMFGGMGSGDGSKMVARDKPQPDEARSKQVKAWIERVEKRRTYLNENEFRIMNEDMDFAEGYQVMDADGKNAQTAEQAKSYVVQLALRHVNERVATLYAKNPKVVAKRRQRMDSPLWDGSAESVKPIDAKMAQNFQMGLPQDPGDVAFMQAVSDTLDVRQMIDSVGKTLEILYQYFMEEGTPPFKTSMKQVVRRTETTGVGYVKLGFQRVMQKNNEIETRLTDAQTKLARIESLSADMADQEFEPDSASAEELKELIQTLQSQLMVIAREGLTFDYPSSTAIIPSVGTKNILAFVGSKWIAEEHNVPKSEIQDRFKIDVGDSFTKFASTDPIEGGDEDLCRWYEIYDLVGQVVRHVLVGYPDYLEEPKSPEVFFEQGHPYFTVIFNNLESRKTCFPKSDVRIIRSQCVEYNRMREGLRRHRIANRPAYVGRKGLLDKEDLLKFGSHQDSEMIELQVNPQEDVSKVFMPKPTVPIDPTLYDVESIYADIQREVGSQQADFGGTSGATATEVSVAENSRSTSVSCDKDGLDEMLTALARAAGQVMFDQMSVESVKKIAGEGAVWPELSRQEIAEELYLEIEAGSSGAPNEAQELANMERALPMLVQLPGLSPEAVAGVGKKYLSLLKIDVDTPMVEGLPSIQALNAMSKAAPPPGAGSMDPNAQGAQGANNKPAVPGAEAGQPTFPAPDASAPAGVTVQ